MKLRLVNCLAVLSSSQRIGPWKPAVRICVRLSPWVRRTINLANRKVNDFIPGCLRLSAFLLTLRQRPSARLFWPTFLPLFDKDSG